MVKLCKKCGILKLLEAFSKDKRYPLGRTAICKACSSARIMEWRKRKGRGKNIAEFIGVRDEG